MYLFSYLNRFKKYSAIILFWAIFCTVFTSVSDGVTTFSTDLDTKETPVELQFDDIWFYDTEMVLVIPDIRLDWLTVVFRPGLEAPEKSNAWSESEALFVQTAKEIVGSHSEIIDYFYDRNLAKDACFFKLREGLNQNLMGNLICLLNKHRSVAYTHPTIGVKGKTHAFFNAFDIEWKTGVEQALREAIMNKAHVSWDKNEYTYRVALSRAPFFKAMNLIAEDIHVLKVTPYLVELKPSITAELTIPISGSDLGDEIPFSLHIAFSELIRIDPSSIANIGLRPSDVQKELFDLKVDPYDYVEAASKSPVKITGWMKFYTPGDFVIPAVKIQYTSSTYADNKARSIETKPLPFKVSSIVPAKQEEKKLIIPMGHLEPNYKIAYYQKKARTNLLLSFLFFFITIICAGWLILKLYQQRKKREKLLTIKQEDLLADKLKAFLVEAPSSPHAVYVAEVGKLLRAYLVARYQIGLYPAGGSGEVFFESIKDTLPEALVSKIGTLFKKIDDIVALELDTFPEIEPLRSEALEILNATQR